MQRIQNGEHIPGVYIKESLGNRTFTSTDPEEIEKMVKSKYPKVEVIKTETITKARTITDLEKELGKGSLDTLCQRKVKKEIAVMDGNLRDIIGGMTAFIDSNQ